MTSARRCMSRGALLLALMAGSPAVLSGAVAHADPLAPLPVPLPTVDVPLLGTAASPSPSPTPTASQSPSASPAPTATAQDEPTAAPAQQEQPAASTVSAPEPVQEQASTASAAEPVAAAAAAPITTTSVPAAQQPLTVDVTGALPTSGQWPSRPAGAPFVATPQREAIALAGPSSAAALEAGAAPVLSSGLLTLPDLAALRAEHGLGARPAPGGLQAPLIAPELTFAAPTSPTVVRASRVAQQEPAKPVGTVLFMMAAAAGAAAAARLRMVGSSRRG